MEIIIAVLVIFIGSYVQSSIGFGLAIIAAPVLFFIDPLFVPAPITLCALTLSLANAVKHWHSISFEGLKFAILGRIPGTVAGGLLLLWIDQQQLALWLGISVISAVLLSLANVVLKPTPGALLSAGFLSGFMGTSSSIGGPPNQRYSRTIRSLRLIFYIRELSLQPHKEFGNAEARFC